MTEHPFIINIQGYATGASAEVISMATKQFLTTLKTAGAKIYGPAADPEKPTQQELFSKATIRHAIGVSRTVFEKRISFSGPQPGTEQMHPTSVDAQVNEDLLTGNTVGSFEHMKAL